MKVWKRLLCSVLFLVALSLTAHASEPSKLTVTQTSARRGETVSIDVSLDQVNGIAGGGFNVVYDNQNLTLISAEADLGGGSVNPRFRPNAVRISFANSTALKSPGRLLKLTFQVNQNAPLGLLPISVEEQKFYSENIETVPVEPVAGGISVQAVELSLSSDDCLPGQAVKLELSLSGGLYPAGGEFEITYNPRLLTASSVKAEMKMGNTPINLSYNIDANNNVIRIIWAASEPIETHGRLCTIIFAVSETASGKTPVKIQNPKFYDENANPMECLTPTDGTVTIVNQYQEQPTLYMVGGKLADDGKTATVQIAVDGAGVVCGGAFQVSYDPALCTLTAITPKMACVAVNPDPEKISSAAGTISVSWAEDSPALDNETILELTFQLPSGTVPVSLSLQNAVLKNNKGQTIENTKTNGGKIGISSSLQAPAAELVHEESSIGIQATLYDAEFCGDDQERTTSASVILAAYLKNGKLSMLTLPSDAVTFDQNGIAQVSANMQYMEEISELRLFILDASGNMTPLCEKVEFPL